MIKALSIAFAICLLSLMPASVLADGNGQGGPGGNGGQQGQGGDQGQDKPWKDGSSFMNGKDHAEGSEMMLQESVRHRFFGHFNLTDGVADGRFVAFTLDESSGEVSDYALRTGMGVVTVFDSIQIPGLAPENISVHGSVMLLRNETVQVIVHDNPTGMYHAVSNATNVTVSFLLAEGISALPLTPSVDYQEDQGDQEMELRNAIYIVGQGISGIITTDDGNISMEATEDGIYVNVTFSDDQVMFRAHPVLSHHRVHDAALLKAISEGRVAGEMSLLIKDGLASYDAMEYGSGFSMQLVSAERNRVQLKVESQEHAGKVIVLNVDQGSLDSSKGEFTVQLDGADVRVTTNPLEVLYAEGSEVSDAVCCVIESEGTNQILVYIPSFSVHVLDLTSLGPMDALLSGMGIAAILGAVAIVGVAGIILFKRRR